MPKKYYLRLGCLLSLFLALTGIESFIFAQSNQRVSGRVVDTQNSSIEAATIRAKNGRILAVTDATGQFWLPAGISEIQVTALGFLT